MKGVSDASQVIAMSEGLVGVVPGPMVAIVLHLWNEIECSPGTAIEGVGKMAAPSGECNCASYQWTPIPNRVSIGAEKFIWWIWIGNLLGTGLWEAIFNSFWRPVWATLPPPSRK